MKKYQKVILIISIILSFLSSLIPLLGIVPAVLLIILFNSLKKSSNTIKSITKNNVTNEITKTSIDKIENEEDKNLSIKTTINNKIYNPDNLDSDTYIELVSNLPKYNLGQALNGDYINSLKTSKELDYEKYMKCTITTSRPESFVVIDFETTGLNAETNEIIQIGAIKYDNCKPVETFSTYIKPKKKISSKITSITGITNDMLENAPAINDIIPHLINFIGEYALVAHNAPFDMSFLYNTLFNHGYKKPKNKVIDTLKMARSKIREYDLINDKLYKLESYKLEELKDEFFLYDIGSHDALDDCKVCGYIYLKIISEDDDYVLV